MPCAGGRRVRSECPPFWVAAATMWMDDKVQDGPLCFDAGRRHVFCVERCALTKRCRRAAFALFGRCLVRNSAGARTCLDPDRGLVPILPELYARPNFASQGRIFR